MKAVSIKQPWAQAIAAGIKDVENRSWKTNFRGKIYIHASADRSLNYDVFSELQFNKLSKAKPTLPHLANLPYAAIIGEVDIIDCVRDHPSVWAEKDCYNWVLANAKLYDHPILDVKGALSFWEFAPEAKKNLGHFFKNFNQ